MPIALPPKEALIRTIKEVSNALNRNPRDVRTLVLAKNIPTVRLGHVFGLTEDAFELLKKAFAELDVVAEARVMAVPEKA